MIWICPSLQSITISHHHSNLITEK